jgi:hypothetical protein
LAKGHLGRVFTTVAEPFAMLFDELCEPGFRYGAMRSFKGLPNFFATSKSAGIIIPRLLMLENGTVNIARRTFSVLE